MARSFANGDYRLLMVIESSSTPGQWYRQGLDKAQSARLGRSIVSCDCPAWTRTHRTNQQGDRVCKHSEVTVALLGAQVQQQGTTTLRTGEQVITTNHAIIAAVRNQWPGLAGQWSIQEKTALVGSDQYHFVLLRLVTPLGDRYTGVVAFSTRHGHTVQERAQWVAAWGGAAIALEVAQRAGLRFTAPMPAYYREDRAARAPRAGRAAPAAQVGLVNLLQMAENPNLGDGLRPWQRAEQTLRLFLGDLFPQLERDGYLDVSSQRYPGRVYRLRRDRPARPEQRRDRRLRVFIDGRYRNDYCIVRAQNVPADDQFLTNFLLLCSGGEDELLSVVKQHNIFPPYSDGSERETVPAVWRPRQQAA